MAGYQEPVQAVQRWEAAGCSPQHKGVPKEPEVRPGGTAYRRKGEQTLGGGCHAESQDGRIGSGQHLRSPGLNIPLLLGDLSDCHFPC